MLRRTESSLIYFLIFAVLVIAAVAVSNVWLYRQFSARLDHSLGVRLQSTARAAALLVDAETLVDVSADSVSLNVDYIDLILADRLGEFVESFGIDEILLLDERFQLVYDSGETYLIGDPYPYLDQDAEAIRSAIESGGAYSPTTQVGVAYLKRGFAPIISDTRGRTALLVVEADVDFFNLLRTWKRTLTTVTVGVAAILILLALLFLRLWSAGDRARRLLVQRDKLATLGRMVSQVAHEIRNPLGIIKISAQRLRRSTDPSQQQELVDYVLSEAARLDGIVDRYLNYAKGRPAQRQQVATVKLIDEVFDEITRSESRSIRLAKTEIQPETVWIDRARAKQLLYNLIHNSIKAEAKTITVAVGYDSSAREGTVRWTVEDDGAGIPPRQLKRVFEPFYTTHPDGSGLGLSIVRQIAEEHGGSVSIESRPGRGTTVTVEISGAAELQDESHG